MKKILILILIFHLSCKNKLKSEIDKLLAEENYISVAILCSENQSIELEKECKIGFEKTEEEIKQITQKVSDLPFTKIHIDKEKRNSIENLLKKNIHLGVKYSVIWNETVYSY